MNNIKEKIIKVNKEHLELLSLAKEELTQDNNDTYNFSKEVLNTIKYDEKNIKKYEATVKAQNLIQNLTEQILNSNSPEEIVLLRKKINYNINKIKAELARRNVPQEVIDNYNKEVSSIRKSIAVYIRFLKREENINEINRLSINIDNLNKEELTNLKKCLQKEKRYNTRYLNEYKKIKENSNTEEISVKEEEKNTNQEDELFKNEEEKEIIFEDKDVEVIPADIIPSEEVVTCTDLAIPFYGLIPKEKQNSKTIKPNITDYLIKEVNNDVSYEETSKYFNDALNQFSTRFDIVETLDYSKKNVPKNALNLLRNIPRYLHNKKVIEEMKRESFMYYSGYDFISFIECMKERNSISNALKYIFKDSSLTLKEKEFLTNHENCLKWMHDFCAKRNASVCIRI